MRNRRGACALLLLTSLPWAASAQQRGAERDDVARFRARAAAVLSAGDAAKGHWGVLIGDADTGEVLYALNPAQYFAPASNAKLFTTALALATLGPDFRVHTTVETSGAIDGSGRLRGDLVLVGRGDANLSNRVFPYAEKVERNGPPEAVLAELADRIVGRGIKKIEGDVVADDSYLASGRFPSGWTVDDAVWSYGAAVSAIAVNDNEMTLEVRPGGAAGEPLRFHFTPSSGLYKVRNDAVTSSATSEPQLQLSRDPESRVFRLGGSLPVGAAPRALPLAVPEPAENAAALFVQLLEARGVRVAGRSRARHAGDPAPSAASAPRTVLAEHLSPPLLDDVRLTNKISQNLHAELLLRVAAKEKGGAESLDDALKFAAQFLRSAGLVPEDVLLKDGSGLSRDDLVTPEGVSHLLAYVARQPWGADFIATLPLAGEDGTLANRMKGTAAAGRIHAKTGQVDHVEALSGFATSLGGERLIFSILGNDEGVAGRDAAATVDMLCLAMVEELGVVPPAPVLAPAPAPEQQ